MSKRIIALFLCAIMIVPLFAGCGSKNPDDKGPYITMYLSDDIYDFDPINAYYNTEARNVVSMMFDTLFRLNSSGKIEKSLAKSYYTDFNEDTQEYTMEIVLREAYWSNGNAVTAEDVIYSWTRLLRCDNSNAAAAMLFDIKNARVIAEGGTADIYIDELGVEAIKNDTILITFEGKPDYDQFMLNLTSLATAPVPESLVAKNPDWAKKGGSLLANGPYKLGKIVYVESDDFESDANGDDFDGNPLTEAKDFDTMKIEYFFLERNAYYNRDIEKDDINKAVTNYRLLVDCSKTDEEILKDYQDGKIFYMGSIPLSIREDDFIKENVKISNALSTTVCYLNENAMIYNGTDEGCQLFADANVRRALSLALDREAIAKAVVYAEAASALVCPGVFDTVRGTDFRANGGALLNKTPDLSSAWMFLNAAGITELNAADFSFTIKVASYDDVHIMIANMLAKAWGSEGLGFDVSVEEINPIVNNDYVKENGDGQIAEDVCDDLFVEDIQQGDFEVAIFDYVAYSADAYSMLANFAAPFSGSAVDHETFEMNANATGYNSAAYNAIIEAIYYLPYFANLTEDSYEAFGIYDDADEFKATYNSVKEVYAANGITPSKNSKDWNAQRAKLLHAAEALLMTDVPVIPLVFNQNAELISDELTNVTTNNYYVPALFTKTDLKCFDDFCYEEEVLDAKGQVKLDKNGDPVIEYKTIFDEFPVIAWDKADGYETSESTDKK